jgi:hypothetical protein
MFKFLVDENRVVGLNWQVYVLPTPTAAVVVVIVVVVVVVAILAILH